MTKAQKIAATWLVLVNAALALAVSLGAVSWSAAQVALVYAEANTATALALALYVHFTPATKKEPVAIAGSLTALATSTVLLLVGFHVWHLTDAQIGVVGSFTVAIVSLVTTAFARANVTAPTTPPRAGV